MATNINVNDILLDNQVAFVTSAIPLASNIGSFSLNTSSYKIAPSDSAGKRYISRQSNIFNGHWGNTSFDAKLQQDSVNFPFVTKNSASFPYYIPSGTYQRYRPASTARLSCYARTSSNEGTVTISKTSDGQLQLTAYNTSLSSETRILPDSYGRNIIFIELEGASGGGGGGTAFHEFLSPTPFQAMSGGGGGSGAIISFAVDFAIATSIQVTLGYGGFGGRRDTYGNVNQTPNRGSGDTGGTSTVSVTQLVGTTTTVINDFIVLTGGEGGLSAVDPSLANRYTLGGAGGTVTITSSPTSITVGGYRNGATGGRGVSATDKNYLYGNAGESKSCLIGGYNIINSYYKSYDAGSDAQRSPSSSGWNCTAGGSGGGAYVLEDGTSFAKGGGQGGYSCVAWDALGINGRHTTTDGSQGGVAKLFIYY